MYGLSNDTNIRSVTLSELEGHFCCYDWQNASCGPSAFAELLMFNSALTVLVGWQEGYLACKNWVLRYWHGYLSEARCKWFAYGPANATTTPLSLASLKSRMVLPFWCRITQVIEEKRQLNSSTHTHTQPFYCSSGICPGPPEWAGTRKVKPRRLKPIWIYWSKR